jgi:hypothetical protein
LRERVLQDEEFKARMINFQLIGSQRFYIGHSGIRVTSFH